MLPRSHGYLSQDVAHETFVAEGSTVRDYMFNSIGLDVAIASFEELSHRLGEATNGDMSLLLKRFEEAQESLERLG